MIYDKTAGVIKELFKSFLNGYQIGFTRSMKSSDFIFYCIIFLHCKCHEINLKRGGSKLDSPNSMKNKTATKNPINDDDKCL